MKKLNCYGVRGLPLQFLSSCLTSRQQYIVVHPTESCVKSVSCGVPHGSALGPLLFLIYVNDLPDACNLRIQLFCGRCKFGHVQQIKSAVRKPY